MNDERLPENPLKRKFVARQPIFDKYRKVVAYELLFRSGWDNVFAEYACQDHASSRTLVDSFLLFDIKELAGGKRAFINFTRKVLLSDQIPSFPKDLLVVELLETIDPDKEVIEVCKKLKKMRYILALDDFVFRPEYKPLMQFLDIVKIDFLETSDEEKENVFRKVNRENIKFLAEKVETMEDFNRARELGYCYFQGFFFSRPVIISSKDIPSIKSNLLELLSQIHQPEADFFEIEAAIKKDVSLAYKLIRFINSASFGIQIEVHSIMQALNLLGLDELRKWISLVALSQLCHDEPEELLVSSVVRARFCELTAEKINMKERSAEFFLVGLFSLIDAFFERTMQDVLKELPLSLELKQALIDGTGIFGDTLYFVKAYERGDWEMIFQGSSRVGLNDEDVPELYYEAIRWSNALKIGGNL